MKCPTASHYWQPKQNNLRFLNRTMRQCSAPPYLVRALSSISTDGDWLDAGYVRSFHELCMKVKCTTLRPGCYRNLFFCVSEQPWSADRTHMQSDISVLRKSVPSWLPDSAFLPRLMAISRRTMSLPSVKADQIGTLAVRALFLQPCREREERANGDCLSCWLRQVRRRFCCAICTNMPLQLGHDRSETYSLYFGDQSPTTVNSL